MKQKKIVKGKNHEGQNIRRFHVPNIPPTANKTIRFPNDIIEQVEKEIVDKNCTFSAFVVAAVRMALEELEQQKK